MLKDIYEKEVIGSGGLLTKAPAGRENIYLISLADEANVDDKVPFYLGKSANPPSRLSRHGQVAWHNAIMREPAQVAVVIAVPESRILEAEQELINDLTHAGFFLTNRDIRDSAVRQTQIDADLLNWNADRLHKWKSQAPSLKPVLDAWLKRWSESDSTGNTVSTFQFWTPPAHHTSLERDYAAGTLLPWALLGLMNPEESEVNIPMWSLMDATGLYWREVSEAVTSLEASDFWEVTNLNDGTLTFRYQPPTSTTSTSRNALHRHQEQRIDWLQFTGELRKLHREYANTQYGVLPFTLEPRNPELDPEGHAGAVVAFCFNDGTHMGHPYYFTNAAGRNDWTMQDKQAIKWHQKKFGTDPGVRVVYHRSQASVVTHLSLADEAWAAGYYLLEFREDNSVLLVNAQGEWLEGIHEYFNYKESVGGLYEHRHLSSTATVDTAKSAVPLLATPYALSPYELHHLESQREAVRLLAERDQERKQAFLLRRYGGLPDTQDINTHGGSAPVMQDSTCRPKRPVRPSATVWEEPAYDVADWDDM